jgi:Gpi18-like mannosyltransferase
MIMKTIKKSPFNLAKIPRFIPRHLTSQTNTILRWIMIGLFIRFLFMPIMASTDFTTSAWISLTLIQKNQLVLSADPPAIFFVLGFFYKLLLPLFPQNILNFLTSSISFTPLPFQAFSLLESGIHTFLFVGKLPFFLFDFLSAFLLLHLFSDGKKALFAFKLWLINPIVIAITYVYGQYDITVVFFLILSLYFLKKNKYEWSALALGIGAIFKFFTLALLPIVALGYWKNQGTTSIVSKTIKTCYMVMFGFLPLLLIPLIYSVVPQYYESANVAIPPGMFLNGFFGETFYSQGVAAQPFYSGIFNFLLNSSYSLQTNLTIPDFVYFIPFIYTLLLLSATHERQLSFEKIFKYFAVFLLLYYAFSLFYPQWFLWIQPLFIMLLVEKPKTYKKLFLMIIPLFFFYTLQSGTVLTTVIITPVVPQALLWESPLTFINDAGFPGSQLIGISRTFLSAICVFMAFYIIKESFWIKKEKNDGITTELPTRVEPPMKRTLGE